VMGSSLALNCESVQAGLMRRSAESWGGAGEELELEMEVEGEGTVMRRGMSGPVVVG
jgi:hypothetical protein